MSARDSERVSTSFDIVTFDSPNPDDLASFWCAALDLVESEREDGDRWIALSTRGGARRIGIQRGETARGSVHLDLACGRQDFDAETARLVSLGATLLGPARHEPYGSIVNLADRDGNVFDLCAYQ